MSARMRALLLVSAALIVPSGAHASTRVDPAREFAVRWALAQVGTHEIGTTNCGPRVSLWQRHMGVGPCVPWCGAFVHEAYLTQGIEIGRYAIAPTRLYRAARAGRGGLRLVPRARIRRGDLVLMHIRPGLIASHLAIATAPLRGGAVPTVEGNTSQRVARKRRAGAIVVAGVRVAISFGRQVGDSRIVRIGQTT